MMENLKRFFINGEWVDPISDQNMLVINPATEEQIGTVALGNARDVDLAVEGEPLNDGVDDGTTRLGDDQRLHGPDQTENSEVGQGVYLQYVKRLQNMSVLSVHLDCHTNVETGYGEGHDRTYWVWYQVEVILVLLGAREVDWRR